MGLAVSTMIGVKLAGEHGLTGIAINTAGSSENIHLLKSKKADLAVMEALIGSMAYEGTGLYEGRPTKNFSSITMLWENVEHFVLRREHAKTGAINDLNGSKKIFSIGMRGSVSEDSARTILAALGLGTSRDFVLEFLDHNFSAVAMMEGKIAGASFSAEPPVEAVTSIFTIMGGENVSILEFTDEQLEKIRGAYPIWTRYVIKAGTYPGQSKDIKTIAQPNFLASRPDLSEETVYLITKTIYENKEFLQNIHEAAKGINIDRALNGLPAPLHPGAARFYKEKGIEIPPHLLPR